MHVLITGGAGYIGSHVAIELQNSGHTVIIADNLANGNKNIIKRIAKITGIEPIIRILDLTDRVQTEALFEHNKIDAVIHLAGLKAVGDSVKNPILYYDVNINVTLSLLRAMMKNDVQTLIYSSSATVYGTASVPYKESMQTGTGITSPYGKSKHMIEEILKDVVSSNTLLKITSLRYFNPIGAHPSGLVGEAPNGIPNNLMPYITQVAAGKRDKLYVFGDNYNTPDGTCVRDYIHVVDVAKGHVAALDHSRPGFVTYNLGSGTGTSVFELVKAFEAANDLKIAYEIAPRRVGDLPAFFANVDKAHEQLHWHTTLSIKEACRDAWQWEKSLM